jgi:tRNA(fMet)-specific endonuclease VapC
MKYLIDTNICIIHLKGINLNVKGIPIRAYDLQIVAIALANNLMLVTHNTKEFGRVDGLQVEDWEVEA